MRVSKWGNSLAVRLPKALVDAMKLAPGDELGIVEAAGNTIAVEKRDRDGAFLAAMDRMSARGWVVPEGYRFDRDEANGR